MPGTGHHVTSNTGFLAMFTGYMRNFFYTHCTILTRLKIKDAELLVVFASAKHSHGVNVISHLLSVETSKERQFVALTTALDQILSRGCRNACVLTFLGLGQGAASPP